ncbi:MAG TPA: hypothetical protein PKX55_14515, partial [Leptospiraceae bacterium]|nr:hypothetical protein [Leptospiraceae bacterium]
YGRGDAKKKMRDKKGAEKDYYWAMTIEEDIKSGKRKPIQKGETPEQVYPFPYSEKYRNIILQGLREAVKNGTLSDINLIKNNVQILGGKTGSPTREGKKYSTHGWSIIFF